MSERLIPGLGSALGVAELSLALLLVTGTLPGISLPITVSLLWLFVLLIVRSLWAGERFAFLGFGDADSELSTLTLVRTVTLAPLASVAAFAPPPVATYPGFGGADALQAASAMANVGTIVLVNVVPRLLRWNKDLYRIGEAEVNE